jgi:hypothetical protein
MPYSTLVAGTTITASWANANVRDQVVSPFATTAARDSAITSPVNGMVANITDDDVLTTYNGSAWVVCADYGAWGTWTPTVTQSGTVTHTATVARYSQVGKLIVAQAVLNITGTGTATNTITVSLPVNSFTASAAPMGSGNLGDVSTGIQWGFVALTATASTVQFISGNGSATGFLGGSGGGFTAALASGDVLIFNLVYEAA